MESKALHRVGTAELTPQMGKSRHRGSSQKHQTPLLGAQIPLKPPSDRPLQPLKQRSSIDRGAPGGLRLHWGWKVCRARGRGLESRRAGQADNHPHTCGAAEGLVAASRPAQLCFLQEDSWCQTKHVCGKAAGAKAAKGNQQQHADDFAGRLGWEDSSCCCGRLEGQQDSTDGSVKVLPVQEEERGFYGVWRRCSRFGKSFLFMWLCK